VGDEKAPEYKDTPPEAKTVPKETDKSSEKPSQSSEKSNSAKTQATKLSSTSPSGGENPTLYKPPGGKPKRKYSKRKKPSEWKPGWRW